MPVSDPALPVTVLKQTESLCPVCLERLPAEVIERDGRVYIRKECPAHGSDEALLASDSSLYWNEDAAAGPGCGSGCCSVNHSCTLIFEITERCNLMCPTCFAGSSPKHTWTLAHDDFVAQLDELLAGGKSGADIVQLSGGEPTVHPDLERMVQACFDRGIERVYINTNGVKLGTEPELARRLAEIDGGLDRVQFYLQFDGFEEQASDLLRGAKGLLKVKEQAIRNAIEAGLYVMPVMTLARGINLHDIGAVWEMVKAHHPKMNTLMLQPAFFSGRYENERSDRLTMSEVAHEAVRQTGVFTLEDFGPIPCSHPACFGMAVGLVHDGQIIPISRFFPRFESWSDPSVAERVERFSDRLPMNMLPELGDDELVEELLDLLTGDDDTKDWSDYRNFIIVSIKPFMDAHTYDQDRIDRCCVHIVDRAGLPVSFCEYNAVRRPLGRV